MFPTDHDFRRNAIAQATEKRIATRDFWMIESYLSDRHRAAKYEQLVFVGGDARLMVDLDSGEPTWRDIPQTNRDGLK